MTHVGQKLTLDTAGFFRFVFGGNHLGIGIEQLGGAFEKINREPVPLGYRRSYDESRRGDHEHEKTILRKQIGCRRREVQCDHNAKIERE